MLKARLCRALSIRYEYNEGRNENCYVCRVFKRRGGGENNCPLSDSFPRGCFLLRGIRTVMMDEKCYG